MRYSEVDLQCEDITWFGVDADQRAFMCTSGGIGCVPEFVCRSVEETEYLLDFFTNTLNAITKGRICGAKDSNPLIEECLVFSTKGLYCFDVDTDETYGDFYRKVTYPERELFLRDLPASIRKILADHVICTDVSASDKLIAPHAY